MGKKRRPSYQELYEAKGDARIRFLTEIIFPLMEENQKMTSQNFEACKEVLLSNAPAADKIWRRVVDRFRLTERTIIEKQKRERKSPEG
ncbi:hypothetical protein L0222_21470 [bacterium]|nr:hypothetical protein [bacterium]MCI0607174.1 hypothetical protein [bacterium]